MKHFRITTVKWDNDKYTELYCTHASKVDLGGNKATRIKLITFDDITDII